MNAINKPNEVSMFKVGIKSEAEFKEVMALAESMGYYNGLEFKDISIVKTLFLPDNTKHIQWSPRPPDEYDSCFGLDGKEISIQELKEIAAGHRIDGSLTNEGSKLETLRDCDTSPNCKKYKERVGNNE